MENAALIISIVGLLFSGIALIITWNFSKIGVTNTVVKVAHQKADDCNRLMKEFTLSQKNRVTALGLEHYRELPYEVIGEVMNSVAMLNEAFQHYSKKRIQLDSTFILGQFWMQLSQDVRYYCIEPIQKSTDKSYTEEYYDNVRKIQQVFGNQIYKRKNVNE